MRGGCTVAAAFCFLAFGVGGATAQAGTPPKADVATLLFDQPMWRNAQPDAILRYGFSRRTGASGRASSFDDDIVVELSPGAEDNSRTCDVRMFSGTHAEAAGPFYSTKVNPVLVLVLEQNVQELARLTGIDSGHLKEAVRKAWRDDAKIVEAPVSVAGRQVAGTRITVTPFRDDPARAKMRGLDALAYSVEIADAVPGRIARIDIRTPAGRAPVFSETLRYIGSKRP